MVRMGQDVARKNIRLTFIAVHLRRQARPVDRIDQEVRDGIKLTPVKTYDEIFAAAFVP